MLDAERLLAHIAEIKRQAFALEWTCDEVAMAKALTTLSCEVHYASQEIDDEWRRRREASRQHYKKADIVAVNLAKIGPEELHEILKDIL